MLTPQSLAQATQRYAAELADGSWGLYFHGTARPFDAFADEFVGMSKDANSGLGHFVTSNPGSAANYAHMVGEDKGVVLAVLLHEHRPFEFDTFESFYGADWPDTGEPGEDRAHFVRLRQQLIEQGYDSAFFTLDDDGLIGIGLQAKSVLVLGALTQEQARCLSETIPEHLLQRSTAPESKTRIIGYLEDMLYVEEAALA